MNFPNFKKFTLYNETETTTSDNTSMENEELSNRISTKSAYNNEIIEIIDQHLKE